MSILQSGAGLGPAITFLFSSPAINLISTIYTWKIIPTMLLPRIFSVFFCSIGIGILMNFLFSYEVETREEDSAPKKSGRTPAQEWGFFVLLLIIMLTSTDFFSIVTDNIFPSSLFGANAEWGGQISKLSGKLLCLFLEVMVLIRILYRWFTWDETRKWLKRTGRQAMEILPMVFLGMFYSGMLGGASFLVDYLGAVEKNTLLSNLIASFIGAILYFGSIVGVNVVDLFIRWGMHKGPALALLLSGPAVSLPSVLALVTIIGKKKALTFLCLVILFTTMCGLIFGNFM